jgi:hypothetical protein
MGQRIYNFDAEMLLKDAGLVAASAAALVGGVAQILDVGVGRFEGVVVLDASAIEIASNDENYLVIVQGSASATFATGVENLAMLDFGALEARKGFVAATHTDSLAGRYEIPFTNEQNDIRYRYVRLYTVVVGAIATGINYKAFIAPVTWG